MPATPPCDATCLDVAEVRAMARALAPEIATLPRLSRVVESFLADAGRDTATAADIARALALDPVIEGWVLRQANSGYAKLARPVTSVAEACVVLGLASVTRLVFAACTRDLMQHRFAAYRYPGQGFWLHALATATAAGRLAALLGPRAPVPVPLAQAAGLLHDVGKLLVEPRLARAGGPRPIAIAEEVAAVGCGHALVSAAVATTWDLPLPLVMAIAAHHADAPPQAARLVAVADRLVNHWGLGPWTYPRLDLDPPWDDLAAIGGPCGVDREVLAAWCRQLPPLLDGLVAMVRAIGHGAPPALPAGVAGPVESTAGRQSTRRPRDRRTTARAPRRRRAG